MSINPHNLKEFWRPVKYLTKNEHTIPYFIDQDGSSEGHSSQEKATCNLLNSYFTKCFNTRTAPHNFPLSARQLCRPALWWASNIRPNVRLRLFEIQQSWRYISYMLKYTAASIVPSVCKIFNLSIRMGRLPETWKAYPLTYGFAVGGMLPNLYQWGFRQVHAFNSCCSYLKCS